MLYRAYTAFRRPAMTPSSQIRQKSSLPPWGFKAGAQPLMSHPRMWLRSGCVSATILIALLSFAPAPCGAGEKERSAETEEGWESLFDGKTLTGWKLTEFAGRGAVEVKDGRIILAAGSDLTGISWANPNTLPRIDYEVDLFAMRLEGTDFFCGLTFPVRDACCTFVVGGWGGTVAGISSLDGLDASQNETTRNMNFELKRWYHIHVRVTQSKIECWIDEEKVVDVVTTGRKISMRPGEIEIAQPFGISTWQTTGAARDISMRKLPRGR